MARVISQDPRFFARGYFQIYLLSFERTVSALGEC